jgi:hypothetical protein
MSNKIKLLDGKEWDKDNLREKMYDDSFYYGYLGKNALSSSSLKKLLQSPKAYASSLERSEETQALRDGKLIHLMALEPHRVAELSIIPSTKASKAYKEAVAEKGSEYVYTKSEFYNAQKITKALEENEVVSYMMEGMDHEVPEIGMVEGAPFRAKADAISKDRSLIIDLKTTSDVYKFESSARFFKYGLQAELYRRIFGATEFIFIVIDKNTLDIGIFPISEETLAYGFQQIQEGVEVYKKYFQDEQSINQLKNYVIRGIL